MKRILALFVVCATSLSLALAVLLPASADGVGGTIALGAVAGTTTAPTVEVNTSAPTDPWSGFNIHLGFVASAGVTPGTVSAVTGSGLTGSTFCPALSTPAAGERVYACTGISGQLITTAGQLAVFTFNATGNGCIQVTLINTLGDPNLATYTVDANSSSAQTNVVSAVPAMLLVGTGSVPDCGAAGPTNTPTNTPAAATNTPTNTPMATNTPTNTPVGPTSTPTDTPVSATDTPTNTPVGPTETPTNTSVVPTDTPTSTPVGATDTPTATATLVGATNTATATSTSTATMTPIVATNTPMSSPTATATPTENCLTFNQKLRLVFGIFTHFGARDHDHSGFFRFFFFRNRYERQFDLNHDGVINFDDLLIVINTPTCPTRHRR
jgi:hypothetical protein